MFDTLRPDRQAVMFGRSDMSVVRLFNGTATFVNVIFSGGGA